MTQDGDLEEAQSGQAVTLTLTDEIDVSRGDILCDAKDPAGVADQFQVHLIWMGKTIFCPGAPTT